MGLRRQESKSAWLNSLQANSVASCESPDGNKVVQSGLAPRFGKALGAMSSESLMHQVTASNQEHVVKRPHTMNRVKLEASANGMVQMYCASRDLENAKSFVRDNCIPTASYATFIELAILAAFEKKESEPIICVNLFAGLIGGAGGVPSKAFRKGFASLIKQLADIEMDNPRAVEFLSVFIGAVAATKKLGENRDSWGLDFMKKSMSEINDPKRVTKLIVHVLAQLYKRLLTVVSDERERQDVVRMELNSIGVDLGAKMNDWNALRGASILKDMLKEHDVSFILPLLQT